MKWKLLSLLILSNLALTPLARADIYNLCALPHMREHRPAAAVNHVPDADVAHNPSPIAVPDPMQIPLTVDLAQRVNIDLPEGVEMSGVIGFLSVYKDGRILYDGKDLTRNIQDICDDGTTGPAETATEQPESRKDGANPDTGGKLPGMVSGGG